MKSPFRSAVLTLAASLAITATARAAMPDTPAVPAPAAPAVVAQSAIHGLDNLFSVLDAVSVPGPSQVKGMLTGMGTASLGINPLDLVDTSATIRAVAYLVPGADEPGLIFDFPAAGGDPAAFLDKLAGAGSVVPADIPAKAAARLPSGARLFRPASAPANKDSRLLFLPHGRNVALIPMGARGGATPAQAARLLASTPVPPVEGAIVLSGDLDALLPVLADQGPAGDVTGIFRELPFSAFAYGLGRDGTDHLRLALSLTPRAGHPLAPAYTNVAPASPLANAILFPDALAAGSSRSGDAASLMEAARDWQNRFQTVLADTMGQTDVPFTPDTARQVYDAEAELLRLLGDEASYAILPATGGVAAPWAMLAFPDDPSAALDALPDSLGAFLSALLEVVPDDGEGGQEAREAVAGMNPRIVVTGERTVLDVPVRTFTLRVTDTDADPARDIDLASFDAAATGTALCIGDLPETLLSGVLADLAAGTTSRGPVTSMPAFVAAFGDAPGDAAAGYIRIMPLLRTLVPAVRDRVEELVRTYGDDDDDPDGIFPPQLDEFLAATEGLDGTIAGIQQWIPGENRLACTFSVAVSDLRAAIEFIQQIGPRTKTPGEEDFDEDGLDEDGEAPSDE